MPGNFKLPKVFAGQQSPVYVFSFVVLFWTIFDCILTYITPLLIEERGFSTSMIGIIIGTSSVTGAIFDFIICKVFKSTNFKRIFLIMFLVCSAYPLLLWQAKTVWFFIFVMGVWGVYYDLYGFGAFNFVGRYTKKVDHSANFGIVQIFRSIGGILGPLIVGLVVVVGVDWRAFSLSWLFLGIGFVFFLILLVMERRKRVTISYVRERRKNLFIELHLWKKIGFILFPVLVLTFYLFFIESFFWTLAPLYTENAGLRQFGGLFLTAYSLPALMVGWFIGPLTNKFGKKRTAYTCLLIGSVILSAFFFVSNPIAAIVLVFVSSLFVSMSMPAINAAYADYISEAPQVEGEIEGLEDFSFNLGYILGPILAGVIGDIFSIPAAFSILGVFGVFFALALLAFSPKHIVIKTKTSEL